VFSSDQTPENRGLDWPGIVRTLLLQLAILLALAGAVVRYIDWSSDANWAEFNAAAISATTDAKPQPATATAMRAALCARRG
jgi:hypothetical protein